MYCLPHLLHKNIRKRKHCTAPTAINCLTAVTMFNKLKCKYISDIANGAQKAIYQRRGCLNYRYFSAFYDYD